MTHVYRSTTAIYIYTFSLSLYIYIERERGGGMGGACSAYGGQDGRIQGFGGET